MMENFLPKMSNEYGCDLNESDIYTNAFIRIFVQNQTPTGKCVSFNLILITKHRKTSCIYSAPYIQWQIHIILLHL